MNDALLEFGRNVDLNRNLLIDGTISTPWPAAYVYLSNTIPIAPLGAVATGSEKMYLHISVTEDFEESVPPCFVTWYLVSVASDSTFLTEALAQSYNIHWCSGPSAATQYLATKRPFVVPLPPLRNYKASLGVMGLFDTGLTEGMVNIRLTNDIDSNAILPFPNAI